MGAKSELEPLVSTIREKCRTCYTCVRECPAKAIRISGGQAEVIRERCIGCGNCVRVCSQNAKKVRNCVTRVREMFDSGCKVAACLAPSFPAEFHDVDHHRVVGMLRSLGFTYVTEAAFGADLVAARYKKLLAENPEKSWIGTTCPAIVAYVEKYYPSLVGNLAPIASPMIVQGRVIKQLYGEDVKVVFIGPCIAKKEELWRDKKTKSLSGVLTFAELRRMLKERGIGPGDAEPSDFDAPHPGRGILFPIARGMLETAQIREDLMSNQIMATDGNKNFVQVIKEFDSGELDALLLEVLCCNGCIMGSGMTTQSAQFTRRTDVSKYARNVLLSGDRVVPAADRSSWDYMDLSMDFHVDDQRLPAPSEGELRAILEKMGKLELVDELNCGACGYDTCVDHATAIHKGFAESEMCLPYTIEKLKETAGELKGSYEVLVNTKNALIHSEKLASMGQMAAGIAHEVNNPLGVVLLYSNLILEQVPRDSELYGDVKMIVEQADRAKKIVGGLLNFARKNKVVLKKTKINALIEKSLAAIIMPGNIRVKTNRLKASDITAEIDPDQITQVLSNLITNAIEAMPTGGILDIGADCDEKEVFISVKDSGVGIDKESLKKIYEPFYTTKQIGKGTGLGLAVTYGIIKMHRGRIDVQSNAKGQAGPTGTTFTVTLPRERVERTVPIADETTGRME